MKAKYKITNKDNASESISVSLNVIKPAIYIEKGNKPVRHYKIDDDISLVIVSKNKVGSQFKIDLSEQDVTFEDENGEELEEVFDFTIKENIDKIKLRVFKPKPAGNIRRKEEIIVTDDNGKEYRCKAKIADKKGYGIYYIEIKDGVVGEGEYFAYNTKQPNTYIEERGLQYFIKIPEKVSTHPVNGRQIIMAGDQKQIKTPFVPRNKFTDYGHYSGDTSLTEVNKLGNFTKKYEYDVPPVDAVDEGAFWHDKGYDAVLAEGKPGFYDCYATIPADIIALEAWQKVLDIGEGGKNPITEIKITSDQIGYARRAKFGFKTVILDKQHKLSFWMWHNLKPYKKYTKRWWDGCVAQYITDEMYQLFLDLYMVKKGKLWRMDLELWEEHQSGKYWVPIPIAGYKYKGD